MTAERARSDLVDYRRDGELSLDERDGRWGRVRAAMKEAGLDVLVTPPNPGFWDQLQAHATYLSMVGGNNAPVSVVFPRAGEVTAVVGPVPSAAFWRAWQTWTTDVRATHWAVGGGVVARLKELDIGEGRIGMPGLKGSPRFPDGLAPSGFVDLLKRKFPRASLVDATDLLDGLRAQKTAEERAAVGEAVAIAEPAFDVLLAEARAGVPERVPYGRMVGHLIEQGSLPANFLMWAAGTNFGFSLAPFPTGRLLRQGEPIYCEIEARSSSGYIGQITRTANLGAASAHLEAMFELAAASVEVVLGAMKAGATMGDVLAIYSQQSKGSRYRAVPVIHARALGEDRPMIIFDTSDPAILGHILRENAIYAVKVQVRDEEKGEMAFWGESIAIGQDRAVRLGLQPIRLPIIG